MAPMLKKKQHSPLENAQQRLKLCNASASLLDLTGHPCICTLDLTCVLLGVLHSCVAEANLVLLVVF